MDVNGPAAAARFEELARTQGEGWRVPPAFAAPPHMPGADRRRPHPLKSLQQPLAVRNPAAARLPRTYVYCNNPAMGVFESFAERARAGSGWRYAELATDHNPQYMAPGALADLLLSAEGTVGAATPSAG
jgi:hypothetical protein